MTSPLPGSTALGRFPWWLVAIAACVWLPAVLLAGWALDDRELLFDNPVTDGSLPWTAAFGRDYFHHLGDAGQWRPIAALSMRLSRALWGEQVLGYHLENWLLHLAVVAAAAQVVRGLAAGRGERVGAGWLAGLALFAVHPVLADSVVWISGRTSMLGALPPLAGAAAMLATERRGGPRSAAAALAGFGLLVGMLAKEEAIVFAPVLVLLAGSRSRGFAGGVALAVALALAGWWLGRWAALGAAFPAASSPALGDAGLGERLRVGGCAILEGLRLCAFPAGYPPQYRAGFLLERFAPLSSTAAAWLGWGVWLVALGTASVRAAGGKRPVAVAAGLAAIAFLPYVQLLPIGEVFAPRFLYLPLLFAAPLVGALVTGAATSRTRIGLACALAVLAGILATVRGGVYADRERWRLEVLRHIPDDVPSWNDLGLVREERGDLEGARRAWLEAIAIDGGYSRSWSNLGRVLLRAGELREAEATLRKAVEVGPKNPVPRVNLASLLARTGRAEEAVPLYERAVELAPGLSAAWRGLGQARERTGDRGGARAALERALALDPGDREARALLERLDGGGGAGNRDGRE